MNDKTKLANYLVERMTDVPESLRPKTVARALENLDTLFSGLRSLNLNGMEDLIKAIGESDFALANSVKHHAYTSGTLEHTIGVYEKMTKENTMRGSIFSSSELILVSLLHDICMASHPDWDIFPDLHGVKSGDIIRRYIPEVGDLYSEAMFAIEHHGSKFHNEKMVLEHPILALLLRCDSLDADECPIGQLV